MESYKPFGMEEIYENNYVSAISRTDNVPINPLEREVGGNHYKSDYQPIELMEKVRMYACCSYIFKYVYRHKNKGKKQDLEKALHCCELMESLGNNWYQGTSIRYEDADNSIREFHEFIKANTNLDANQVRAIIAISDRDIDSLKNAIYSELNENYA